MKRNQIGAFRIAIVPSPDGRGAAQRANEFLAGAVGQRLQASQLSPAQKLAVLERLIEALSSQ